MSRSVAPNFTRWERAGLVKPSIRPGGGTGRHKRWSFDDVLILRVVKDLRAVKAELEVQKAVVSTLRQRGVRQDDYLLAIRHPGEGVQVAAASNVSDADLAATLEKLGHSTELGTSIVFGIPLKQWRDELADALGLTQTELLNPETAG